MIEVVLNDRLGKKFRVKCKCVVVPRVADWVVYGWVDAARGGQAGPLCGDEAHAADSYASG